MAGAPLLALSGDLPPSNRIHRRPKHKFRVNVFPYDITPFLIAPVLPGETLANAWFECREVTPPSPTASRGGGRNGGFVT